MHFGIARLELALAFVIIRFRQGMELSAAPSIIATMSPASYPMRFSKDIFDRQEYE
jgi:hypothetical protein